MLAMTQDFALFVKLVAAITALDGMFQLMGSAEGTSLSPLSFVGTLLFILISIGCWFIWSRHILGAHINTSYETTYTLFSRFAGYSFGFIGLAGFTTALAIALVYLLLGSENTLVSAWLVPLLALPPVLAGLARFGFMLPASALGRSAGLDQAWTESVDIFVPLLISLTLLSGIGLLSDHTIGALSHLDYIGLIAMVISSVISAAIGLLTIGAITTAYISANGSIE